jgi:UDP-N-acetylglucosamine 2-epimerase (non-hydrolysing)
VGARPQFIKCSSLSKELRRKNEEIIIHTGQHYDENMSNIFFKELKMPEPDFNLNVGSGSQSWQTGEMLIKIEEILVKEKPEMVIVYGDTNSTLAGVLVASKMGITLAHVEAGLRSFDRSMPEEINRVLADHASNLLFAPTKRAVVNLRKEGITSGVYVVGDVMVDALANAMKSAKKYDSPVFELNFLDNPYIVLTIHRPQNTDNSRNLESIFRGIGESKNPIIFPMHPRTRKMMMITGLIKKVPKNLIMIEPVSYFEMIRLMMDSELVVTDSGGMQKEAFLLGRRCITLRDNTEWPETLVNGNNILVGADADRIKRAVASPLAFKKSRIKPFGNIGASRRIATIISNYEYSK